MLFVYKTTKQYNRLYGDMEDTTKQHNTMFQWLNKTPHISFEVSSDKDIIYFEC